MQIQTDASDIEIIRHVLSGEVNAFEILIERYQSHVFSIVRRHVPNAMVDEVAHDVFVRAYQGLAGFAEKSGFKGWLSGISVRACYDFWRKKYRVREVPISQLTDAHQEWLENMASNESAAAFDENGRQSATLEILDWALGQLSAGDRMVVDLIYFEGLSHKEAGALMGWSIPNVKIRSWRAKKKLHKILFEEKRKNRGAG
ncbi:MAG: RNA polymerase sigma factor [Desulfobacteraceae bacterium]|nr:MAG: RNA polymerase sigma factor [Desulfobacteraceae bacterium]